MKNKTNNTKMNGVSGEVNYVSKTSDLANETKTKREKVEVSVPKSTNLYFSSPCLLPEIEDGEYIHNHYCGM
jgi:hypothetical protein